MDNNNESELYECKVDNELRTGKRRFTIESIVDGAKERKGSKFTVLKKWFQINYNLFKWTICSFPDEQLSVVSIMLSR